MQPEWLSRGCLSPGSGSTAAMAVQFLGDRVQNEGLRFQGVATSPATLTLARQLGIQVAEEWDGGKLDLTIDGGRPGHSPRRANQGRRRCAVA